MTDAEMGTLTPVLTDNWDAPHAWTLAAYEDGGGYGALKTALGMAQGDVVEAVKASGLRGRGGAGFPTGMKWGFLPPDEEGKPAHDRYLVVNADESEPGTCKDVPLMMASPHTLVEGVIISSYAIKARHAFIYVRGEVLHVVRRLQNAVREAYESGYLGTDINGSGYDLDVIVHAGAGAYICGEETALLDSLEGRRGQPRLRPPFPAVAGLYASPTVINNVESIASVPSIVANGADWFASMGTEKSKGYGIFSLSGHVKKPGQYEAPLGITLRTLIDLAGGMREGHQLKFWTPGGSSTPILTGEHLDVPLDFEAIGAAGSMLGTRALQLFDDTTCVVRAVLRWTEFYKHESCGKCTPCREGTWWLVQVLARLEQGQGSEADLDLLLDQCDNIMGRSFCALADGAVSPITSSIKYFRDEYLAHLDRVGARSTRPPSTVFAARGGHRMTVSTGSTTGGSTEVDERPGHADHRRHRGQRPQGHPGDPGRRAGRRPDPALLRPPAARRRSAPAASAWSTSPTPATAAAIPKPQASCTITVAPGHGGQHPGHLAGRRQGAAGDHGVPADQPPARLPGLRQGRRVPAAEPGDVQRPRRDPLRRAASAPSPSRSTSPPRCCSTASAACCARAAPGSPSRSPATRSSP